MLKAKLSMLVLIVSTFSIIGCHSTSPFNHTSSVKSDMKNDTNQKEPITDTQLSSYTWQLVTLTDNNDQLIKIPNADDMQVTLEFNQHNGQRLASFSVGCNAMSGSYSLSNNFLMIDDIMSTRMLCEDLDKAERLLASAMRGKSQLSLSFEDSTETQPKLTQVISNGYTLVWKGQKTPEARYHQTGEMVYWEISNTEQVCPDGMSSTCLKVRPIFYDKQGIKKGVGDWSLYAGSIEGYKHDKGLNQIVRLKRFTIDPVAVKGKQFSYVFDTVVESSVAE